MAATRNTEIAKIRISPEAGVDRRLKVPAGVFSPMMKLYWSGPAIRTPEASISREDSPAGSIIRWFFDYTVVQFILGGRAEITYRLPPLYLEEKTFTAGVWDAYVIPKGTSVEFKIDPSGPYKKLCVIIPGFMTESYMKSLPAELAKDVFNNNINGYE
jgi:hypothetical protein